jgi:gas vesicle structural protein
MIAEPQHHAVADEIAADPIARREPLMRNDPLINDVPSKRDSQIRRAPNGAGLYDVLDLILDKGIVIDGFVRVSLVGIELLTIDLRIVVASVDTYLRYAEGVERLGVYKSSQPAKIPDMVEGGMKGHALKQGAQSIGKKFLGGNDEGEGEGEGGEGEEGEHEGVGGKLAQGVRNVMRRGVRGIVSRLAGDEGGEQQDDEADEADQRHGNQPHTARHHHERTSSKHGRDGGGGNGRGGSGRRLPGRSSSAKR